MKNITKQKLFGAVFGFIGYLIFLAILNSGNNTPFSEWPTEAFLNLQFSIGWLSPLPDWAVFIVSCLIILGIILGFNKLGQWLYRKVAGD